jgi:hypothetical protein
VKRFKYLPLIGLVCSLVLFIDCGDRDDPLTETTNNNTENGSITVLDADTDGVADTDDTCQDTPSGLTVDDSGCADAQKDSDGDAITDDLDTCADTAEGALVDENGCSYLQKLTIGDYYQGGIIAYIWQEGTTGYVAGEMHGIIATPSDQSNRASWGCQGVSIKEAVGTAIATGRQNTLAILANCKVAGIAAQLCGDLELDGYNDWYLPSQGELNLLYLNKETIGNFAGVEYWSSSESSTNDAWVQGFGVGDKYGLSKSGAISVRAVRSF